MGVHLEVENGDRGLDDGDDGVVGVGVDDFLLL